MVVWLGPNVLGDVAACSKWMGYKQLIKENQLIDKSCSSTTRYNTISRKIINNWLSAKVCTNHEFSCAFISALYFLYPQARESGNQITIISTSENFWGWLSLAEDSIGLICRSEELEEEGKKNGRSRKKELSDGSIQWLMSDRRDSGTEAILTQLKSAFIH